VLISDELVEVLGMSDRIFVVNNGRVAKEIDRGSDFSEEKIIEVMV
jgi:ribose transport system ATP-binding protein